MKEERTTPLRERMIEDMRIRAWGEDAEGAYPRGQGFRGVPGSLAGHRDAGGPARLPAPHDRRRVSAETFNVRIVSLRFFFGVTCGREEMKRYMQFRHKPRKLPVVLSVEEVADLLAAVPGPG